MKRILHIITGLNMGGAERSLHTLLLNGLQDSHDNHVLSLTDEGYYGPLLKQAGIPVSCLHMKPSLMAISSVGRLYREARRLRPDIVQGWMYHGNIAATVCHYLAGSRPATLWNIRQSLEALDTFSVNTRSGIWLGGLLSRTVDGIVYNSMRARSQHEARGFLGPAAAVIPNGFDVNLWKRSEESRVSIRASLGIGHDQTVIGFVGRNHPVKDLNNFFSAMEIVFETHSNVRVIMVGRDLELAAPDTIYSERIHFLGARPDVPAVLSAFDLFCLSSRSEGFPNVIGEAMSCRVPCVATDVGDTRSIVGNTGWIVPPRDSAALAERLNEAVSLSSAEREQLGLLARHKIEQEYSLDHVLGRYHSLYDNN